RDEAERAVVEHDDLHREAKLREAEKITHQHGEAAIARERDDLSSRECRLAPALQARKIADKCGSARGRQCPLFSLSEDVPPRLPTKRGLEHRPSKKRV